MICQAGPIGQFDPIVYPGQEKAGHLHQFFGNTNVSGKSTYESLRTTGDSTCMNKLNRSAYWVPALLDGKGNVVRPDNVSLYYKRHPKSDPECQRIGEECVEQPDGIKYIVGHDMLGGPTTGEPYVTTDKGKYPDLESLIAAEGKENITHIRFVVSSLDCWDGKNLDSKDHRSHVAPSSYGNWGYLKCPATHQKVIPRFTLGVVYTVDPKTDDISLWRLASDHHAGTKPGGSFHTDLWDAWDGPTKRTWTENCIDKLLSCVDGNLGDGTGMKRWEGFSYTAKPRLVTM